MTEIAVQFHAKQLQVYNDPRRFKVVIAGRRFGKTYYMVRDLGVAVCQTHDAQGRDLRDFPVYYVSPTRDNAKRNTWRHFKNFLAPVTQRVYEKDLIIRLTNGRELYLHGADNPDSLRGDALHRVGLDEYADMKEEVWGEVVRPMLMDVQGGAVFIGTRKPSCNLQRLAKEQAKNSSWSVFRFDSTDNPHLPKDEFEELTKDMTRRQLIQETMGSGNFEGGEVFTFEQFEKRFETPPAGNTYIAMDPAGFKSTGAGQRRRVRSGTDYHAIAVVTVIGDNWYVRDIDYGHWDTREASTHLVMAIRKYRPARVGIEQGALKEALAYPLQDLMKRFGIYRNIEPLRHRNESKQNRIRWALEGRLEKGLIHFKEGRYVDVLRDEALNFPNPLEHDDLLDALAYVAQLAETSYVDPDDTGTDYWSPDEWSFTE